MVNVNDILKEIERRMHNYRGTSIRTPLKNLKEWIEDQLNNDLEGMEHGMRGKYDFKGGERGKHVDKESGEKA